jgi:hypothetical protein
MFAHISGVPNQMHEPVGLHENAGSHGGYSRRSWPDDHGSMGLHNFLGIMPSKSGISDLVSGAGEHVRTVTVQANRSVKFDEGQRKRRVAGGFMVYGRGNVVAGGKLG